MRGRPLLQWMLFALVWSMLAFPIASVTRRGDAAVQSAAVVKETAQVKTWVSLRFSDAPTSFSVWQDGQIIWEATGEGGDVEFETSVMLRRDEFGIALRMVAALGEGLVAVELRLEPDGLPARSRTIWAEGDIDESVDYSWRSHEPQH